MAKRSWQARFRHIEEAVHMMNELKDMPSWEDLTLEEALEIARDVAELNDEVNGDWDFCPYDKQQYMKAKRFIADFGKAVPRMVLINRGKVMTAYLHFLGRRDSYRAKYEALEKAVDYAEPVDAAPVVHARWEEDRMDYKCSACGTTFHDDMFWIQGDCLAPKYCPECGAKMDEGSV